MSRLWKTSAIALLTLLTLAPVALAQAPRRVIVRRYVVVHPVWYDPFWGYWGPPYPYPYAAAPNAGDVKLVTEMKDAAVYIDGGYAGKAGKLKKFSLQPGTHDIQLRDNEGHTFFQERIEVIVSKTTKIEVGNPHG